MATRTMRAAVAHGRDLVLESLPLPEPGPGRVRVRVLACGVCGTDLHVRHAGLWPPGHVPGHEMMGEVDVLGADAHGVAPGDRVAIEPLESCGRCAACTNGRPNICPELRLFGIHQAGGFCEYVVVPDERCFPVPTELDVRIAALAEPVAVGVHGLRRGELQRGQRVLVLGAGAIGLVTVLAAVELGAGEVWISARHPHQAELAAALGASRVLTEEEAAPLALASEGVANPIDLVVETVGGEADTLHAAASAVRPGGTISVVGVFGGNVSVPAYPMLLKEGTLAWSNCYARPGGRAEFTDAIDILSRRRTDLEALTTHHFSLDEIGRAFDTAADKRSGAAKVTILPA